MILSMTGFGEAQAHEDGHAYHVEIRSVNNRYLKVTLRLPEEYGFLEPELDALLRARLTRGSITVALDVRDLSAAAAQELNVAALQHYLSQLRPVLEADARLLLELASLAQLPGVCQPHEFSPARREHVSAVVQRLTRDSLDRLMQMRQREGEALLADLRSNCALVRDRLERIRELCPRVVADYQSRLLARVKQLLSGSGVTLAADDLLKEVAVFADRSDISEELARLSSHVDHFDECCGSPEPAGRRLEFIAQEMMREANTIGSKAGDKDIARCAIDIKSAVDRVKEQVLNIE